MTLAGLGLRQPCRLGLPYKTLPIPAAASWSLNSQSVSRRCCCRVLMGVLSCRRWRREPFLTDPCVTACVPPVGSPQPSPRCRVSVVVAVYRTIDAVHEKSGGGIGPMPIDRFPVPARPPPPGYSRSLCACVALVARLLACYVACSLIGWFSG